MPMPQGRIGGKTCQDAHIGIMSKATGVKYVKVQALMLIYGLMAFFIVEYPVVQVPRGGCFPREAPRGEATGSPFLLGCSSCGASSLRKSSSAENGQRIKKLHIRGDLESLYNSWCSPIVAGFTDALRPAVGYRPLGYDDLAWST